MNNKINPFLWLFVLFSSAHFKIYNGYESKENKGFQRVLYEKIHLFQTDVYIGSEKAVQCLENAVCNSIQTAFRMVDEKKYGLRHHSNTHFSLSSSAFMIPMGYFGSRWWDIDGRYGNEEIIGYQINYMPSGALDEAIKNNPERWALYKKYRDKISK